MIKAIRVSFYGDTEEECEEIAAEIEACLSCLDCEVEVEGI